MQARAQKNIFKSLVVIAVLGMVCLTIFFYIKYQEAQDILSANTTSNSQELKDVMGKVSRHIMLPESESPTLATVSDVEKLRNQAFFLKAENGDKVLVFTEARKAILYRPRVDKIIEVSPITVDGSTGEQLNTSLNSPSNNPTKPLPTQTPQTSQTLRIEIRNATLQPELTSILRTNLATQAGDVEVTAAGNATKNLERTTIVAINPSKQSDIQKIALSLGAEYTTELFEVEQGSTADAIIFIGNDYSEE